MGTVITDLVAAQSDMEIVAGIDVHQVDRPYPIYESLSACTVAADVIIDFSSPQSVRSMLPVAADKRLPAVIATTGLSEDDLALVQQSAQQIPIFRSGNMSLGINLLQQLLHRAAQVLGADFDVEIIEKHHNQKKDAPSGTALMLADTIRESREDALTYVYGRAGGDTQRKKGELGIHAVRGGTIVGQHEVIFAGHDEIITIGHQAFSRQVFATGAIAAARYLVTRQPGVYNMQDMLSTSA
jgi:4-hydroxy-tetrahydrodipicolinate reductase